MPVRPGSPFSKTPSLERQLPFLLDEELDEAGKAVVEDVRGTTEPDQDGVGRGYGQRMGEAGPDGGEGEEIVRPDRRVKDQDAALLVQQQIAEGVDGRLIEPAAGSNLTRSMEEWVLPLDLVSALCNP